MHQGQGKNSLAVITKERLATHQNTFINIMSNAQKLFQCKTIKKLPNWKNINGKHKERFLFLSRFYLINSKDSAASKIRLQSRQYLSYSAIKIAPRGC